MYQQQPPHDQQSQTDSFSVPGTQSTSYQSASGRGFGATGFFSTQRKGLSIIEWGIIMWTVCVLIASLIFGFLRQDMINRDTARLRDIEQVMIALDNFYANSSLDPDERRYPLATCSARLNEVDYELNVRLALTGQRPELDPHAYIEPQVFPRDLTGQYSTTNAQRTVPYRCQQNLPSADTDQIYDQWPSCNFDQINGPRNCYLYTSTSNGDRYEIAYFSESDNGFYIFKRFRTEDIATRFAPL